MRTLYRLRYSDGTVSAWSTNKEATMEIAKFFKAKVETWER